MPQINRRPICALFLLLPVLACTGVRKMPAVFAQDRSDGIYRDAYMVPSKVYLGDRASLVLPLSGYGGDRDAEIPSTRIPSAGDIDIHRVALERRPGGSRLVVEFSAYAPGILELPPLEIAGEVFTGLKIEISSVLDSGVSGTVLSAPALPLAVPGTSLLVYGTIGTVLLSLLLAFWLLFGEHRWMHTWMAAWRRRRLLVSMLRIEKRLRRALAKGADRRKILDTLSLEFRSFLSWFTGENCRAMTAAEIGCLGFFEQVHSQQGGEFLGSFFDRCDGIRFNGNSINDDEALAIFDDVRRFLAEIVA